MDFDVVAEDLGFTEGPVALADGTLAAVSITGVALHLVAPDGAVRSLHTSSSRDPGASPR